MECKWQLISWWTLCSLKGGEREIKIKINGRWDIAAKFIFSFCFIKEMIFALFPLLICFVRLLYLQVSYAKKYSKQCPKFTVRSELQKLQQVVYYGFQAKEIQSPTTPRHPYHGGQGVPWTAESRTLLKTCDTKEPTSSGLPCLAIVVMN